MTCARSVQVGTFSDFKVQDFGDFQEEAWPNLDYFYELVTSRRIRQ